MRPYMAFVVIALSEDRQRRPLQIVRSSYRTRSDSERKQIMLNVQRKRAQQANRDCAAARSAAGSLLDKLRALLYNGY